MLKSIFQKSMLLLFFISLQTTGFAKKFYVETVLSKAYFKDYANNLGSNTLDLNYSKPEKPFIEAGFRFNIHKEIPEGDLGANYNTYHIKTAISSGNLKTPLPYDVAESFKEKNKDSNNGEEYVFKTQSISFGLLYKIEK